MSNARIRDGVSLTLATPLGELLKAFAPALPRKEIEKLRSRSRRTPVEVIELIADVAGRQRGKVGDVRYDAKQARAALARVRAAKAIAKAALVLARRAESDAVRTYALAADRTTRVTVALRVGVRLPEGKALRDTDDEVRALRRAKRLGRKRSAR